MRAPRESLGGLWAPNGECGNKLPIGIVIKGNRYETVATLLGRIVRRIISGASRPRPRPGAGSTTTSRNPPGALVFGSQAAVRAPNRAARKCSNTNRIDALLRAGNLYLSLADAIALGLENNLDVEIQRYEFSIAEADLLRARAGGGIQGIPTNVLTGVPSGAGFSLLGSSSTGLGAPGEASPLGSGLSFDPFLSANVNFGHTTQPQSNTVTSGTPALVTVNKTANFSYSQAFPTGGSVALSYNNVVQDQNSFRSTVNPFTNSSLDLTITQPLLQGFGLALNNRVIGSPKTTSGLPIMYSISN